MIQGYYPISIREFFSALVHINNHFRKLFYRAQAVQPDIISSVPGTDDLTEGEEVIYSSEGTVRTYRKINGSIYYTDWSSV